MFEKILNWKLLPGSHEFPGPDGGTCITEAAIVAAGFKYKRVGTCFDCPPCFSLPIATYAIGLNDGMPDDLRQELLMPFLTRLAGTADRPEIEAARAKLIVFRSIRDIAPLKLRSSGLVSQARRCEQAEDFDAAVDAARNAADTILYILDFAARDAHYAATETRYVAADAVRSAAILCADFVGTPADTAAQTDTSVRRKLFTIGVSILDEAIRLGKQAEAVDNALVAERMEKIKQRLLMPRLRAPVCRRARSSV